MLMTSMMAMTMSSVVPVCLWLIRTLSLLLLPLGLLRPLFVRQIGFLSVETARRSKINAIISIFVLFSRNLVSDIQGKAGQLLTRGTGTAQQVGGGGGGGVFENEKMMREMRDGLNGLKRDFSQTAQQIASSPCPQSGNCVSTTVLVSLLLVQLIILVSFMVYRDGKEKAAKKYY